MLYNSVYEDKSYNYDEEENRSKKSIPKIIWTVIKVMFNIFIGIFVVSFKIISYILKAVFYIFFAIISFLSCLI